MNIIKEHLSSKWCFSKKGFTLVEVFLVASLLSIVLITIFSTYSSGFRIWKACDLISSSKIRNVDIKEERIRRELSGYIRGFKDIPFEGKATEISFPYAEDHEIVKVTYFFDKGDHTLWRKTVRYTESLKDKIKDIKKLIEARKIQFSYLFYDYAERSAEWTDSFSEKDEKVPDAIKMDINSKEGNETEYIFIPK